MNLPHKKLTIKTFEETLLTDEERKERRKAIENDKALAAYYREVLENPENFFIMNENPEADIFEDDAYMNEDI